MALAAAVCALVRVEAWPWPVGVPGAMAGGEAGSSSGTRSTFSAFWYLPAHMGSVHLRPQ